MRYPVLTVWQPWAWAFFGAGKDIENRDWLTRYRGPLWIHAGATRSGVLGARVCPDLYLPAGLQVPWDHLRYGCLLGLVDLIDCVDLAETTSEWATGEFCWRVERPRPLAAPIGIRGRQRLWFLPPEIERLALASVDAVQQLASRLEAARRMEGV